MLYDQRDKRWADLKYETLFITKKLKRFIFSELTINLQGVGPGILTLSPVPYEEILKFFFANTECVSIDRFMLLEQTTAMLSLTILKKILEKINLQKCLQREVFIKFFSWVISDDIIQYVSRSYISGSTFVLFYHSRDSMKNIFLLINWSDIATNNIAQSPLLTTKALK